MSDSKRKNDSVSFRAFKLIRLREAHMNEIRSKLNEKELTTD